MHKMKAMRSMLQSLLVDWFISPRTIISGIVLIALAYMNARSFSYMLDSAQLYAYPGESIYYYLSSGFGNITLTSALFLIMMAEIPRQIAFQNMLLIRSNRRSWLTAQILFCGFATLLMTGIMLALSMLFSIPSISAGSGWSDLERIAADPDAAWALQLTSEYIWQLTPLQASISSFLILSFFWFTMTLIILFCTLFGKPNVGIIVYVSLLVLHVTVLWESLPAWMHYMPVNFATLQYIGVTFPEQELQVVPYTVGAYVLIDLILMLAMSIKVKHMELFFMERS